MTKKLSTKVLQPITTKQIAAFLATTPLFQHIAPKILQKLAAAFDLLYLPGNEILFEQNEIGDALYVVMYGFLHVLQGQEDDSYKVIADLSAGQVVGEIACLIDVPRTASVCAVRDSILLKMTRKTFDDFIEQYPTALMGIARQCVKRLVEPYRPNRHNRITCFTLVPAGNSRNLAPFSQMFVEKLSLQGDTLLITEASFDAIHGKGAAQTPLESQKNADFISWIHQLETKYRFVVYVADKASAWATRCLRQADKILLIGELMDDPELNDLEKTLFLRHRPSGSNIELVLMAKNNLALAYGTNKWLEPRYLAQHYGLRMDKDSDFDRLLRLITGKGVALVLAGGGANALGHLGVIRALEELHIPIDYIGGTSMGALIGGLMAMELDYKTLCTTLDDILKRFTNSMDYTLPLSAILKGKIIGELMREIYGSETRIEELWHRYFCVSSDISANALCVHEKGPLWRAIRSSISLPAIFPALTDENNHIHVDGGILNNLPIDIMQQRINGGKIIASSICIKQHISPVSFEEDTSSGWYLLLKHILFPYLIKTKKQQKKDFISISNVIYNAMILGSDRHQQAMVKRADYNVILNIDSYGLLDFKPLYKIAEMGYRQAMQVLDGLKI